ncbi:biotin synthase BioB [Pajaroellobacter abortibovis]|uniref:Biotin synthase n=1 Tax=Pajaroellobacter abortibovis TaxID=1882918 RepID=A0A1L6MY02_9BACT|nr:biotin synthase BioB [Pajaroellobacter abortibovis]APS00327.1 biotin synthase BioB [Pajaroellobacter abortibovis]
MINAPPFSSECVRSLYDRPLLALIDEAREVQRTYHSPFELQLCTLMNIKEGGCPEDCGYCSQSSHYSTAVIPQKMTTLEEVIGSARKAQSLGVTRVCLGAAWREVKDGPAFERVLAMVRAVKREGVEACVTLGMLTEEQAQRLKAAGLDAYNHNLDTSERYYRSIITTRTFADRLQTLEHVRRAGIGVCSGGILGIGESPDDRCEMLRTLANLDPQPESVPINALMPIQGTPLENQPPIDSLEFVRVIAVARLLMPKARVRLSAGRGQLSREAQMLCMLAGANSIFYGDKLLTTPNPEEDQDRAMMHQFGLTPMAPSCVHPSSCKSL